MPYIFESPTEEQIEEILQQSDKIDQILTLGLKYGRLQQNIAWGKKRLINTENGNYILQMSPAGMADLTHNRYLYYFDKECYLLLARVGHDYREKKIYYYKEIPINLSSNKLQAFNQELIAMFKVGGKLFRENENDQFYATFIPQEIIETTIEEF